MTGRTTEVRLAAVAGHVGRDVERALTEVEAVCDAARAAGADLLALPDATVGGYVDDLVDPLRRGDLYDAARAAENQVWLVSADQTGRQGGLRLLGQAKVVDPSGDAACTTCGTGYPPPTRGRPPAASRTSRARRADDVLDPAARRRRAHARPRRGARRARARRRRVDAGPGRGAFALLRRRLPEERRPALVVAGGETLFDYRPYRAEVDARAAALGVEPVVLGAVPDDDLPALVAAADALAFPSTKEGFGMAPLEALAAGVPVVARDLPVLREVLGDAVLHGAAPPALAAALARALQGGAPDAASGRAVARGYAWGGVAAAHERLYAQVLARGGDGGAPVDLAGGLPAR